MWENYSMSPTWTFDGIENKYDVYIGKNCMKKFCESIREYVEKTINFEKGIFHYSDLTTSYSHGSHHKTFYVVNFLVVCYQINVWKSF